MHYCCITVALLLFYLLHAYPPKETTTLLETICYNSCRSSHSCLEIHLPFVCSLSPKPVARKRFNFSSTLSAGSEQWMPRVCCPLDRPPPLALPFFVTAHTQVSPWTNNAFGIRSITHIFTAFRYVLVLVAQSSCVHCVLSLVQKSTSAAEVMHASIVCCTMAM